MLSPLTKAEIANIGERVADECITLIDEDKLTVLQAVKVVSWYHGLDADTQGKLFALVNEKLER